MKLKRILSLILGLSGAGILIFSLTQIKSITGAVIGTNSTSKIIGVWGLGLMAVAVMIERYKFKKNRK